MLGWCNQLHELPHLWRSVELLRQRWNGRSFRHKSRVWRVIDVYEPVDEYGFRFHVVDSGGFLSGVKMGALQLIVGAKKPDSPAKWFGKDAVYSVFETEFMIDLDKDDRRLWHEDLVADISVGDTVITYEYERGARWVCTYKCTKRNIRSLVLVRRELVASDEDGPESRAKSVKHKMSLLKRRLTGRRSRV